MKNRRQQQRITTHLALIYTSWLTLLITQNAQCISNVAAFTLSSSPSSAFIPQNQYTMITSTTTTTTTETSSALRMTATLLPSNETVSENHNMDLISPPPPPTTTTTTNDIINVAIPTTTTTTAPKTSSKKVSDIAKITTVNCPNDLLEFLSEDDRICVVKFHASWCRICARVGVKYKQLALELGDHISPSSPSTTTTKTGRVRFAQVEVSSNKELCEILHVSKFPFFQIYRKGDKIAAFSSGAAHKFRSIVEGTVKEKLAMSEEEHEVFGRRFEVEIGEGREELERLRGIADGDGGGELRP